MHGDDIPLSIAFVGLLVFLAHLFVEVFRRTRVPDVLFLLGIGLVLGPMTEVLRPEDLGSVGPVFTTVTLVIILFEGGLDLHVDDLRRTWNRTLLLSTAFFAVSMGVVAVAARVLTDLGWFGSFLLGAIVASVSPAVVVPLARQLGLGRRTQVLLALESATSDVLSVLITFGLLEAHRVGRMDLGAQTGHLLAAFVIAIVLGGGAALAWSFALNRMRAVKHSMFTTPAFVFVVYGVVEFLGFSGYIAALAFGVVLGNIRTLKHSKWRDRLPLEPFCLNESEGVFIQEVVFLLKTFFFVFVGLSIVFSDTGSVAVALILTGLVIAVRPPVVRWTLRRDISRRDAVVTSVLAPKGLAAAALASVPATMGVAGGQAIQDLAFTMVLFSIVGAAVLVFLVERTRVGEAVGRFLAGFPEVAPGEDAVEEAAGPETVVWNGPGRTTDE